MGLFDKKTCAVCGKEQRILGMKLADGNYLCSDCYPKYRYSESTTFMDAYKKEAKYHTHISLNDLTLEQYHALVQLREENLEELKDFQCTKSFCGIAHFDWDAAEAIFVDSSILGDKNRLYKENPPVFKMENLAFVRMTFSDKNSSVTVTGKAKAESKINLILGFDDPVYDIIYMEIGKITVKEGMFGTKTNISKDVEELMQAISDLLTWEIAWSAENDVDIPATNMDSYWRLAKKAKDRGYLSSDDIKDCLRNYYGKDRKLMREVKKMYDL